MKNSCLLKRSNIITGVILLVMLTLSGCRGGRKTNAVKSIPVSEKAESSQNLKVVIKSADNLPEIKGWWNDFDDKALDNLVNIALSENLDLKIAAARIKAAEAALKGSGAAGAVMGSLNMENSRSYTDTLATSTGTSSASSGRYYGQSSFSAAASYELDLWGKVSDNIRASESDLKAARFDRETLRITLIASLAETWMSLKENALSRSATLLKLSELKKLRGLIAQRRNSGLASAGDEINIEKQINRIETELEGLQAVGKSLKNSICLMLGRRPEDLPEKASEIEKEISRESGFTDYIDAVLEGSHGNFKIEQPVSMVSAVEESLPSKWNSVMLMAQNRPDVKAFKSRLEAADRRAAMAAKAHLPSLSLSATSAVHGLGFASILDNWTASIISRIFSSISDGGKVKSQKKQAEAKVEEMIHSFGRAVLSGMKEIKDAWNLRSSQAAIERITCKNLMLAADDYQLALSRYTSGAGPLALVSEARINLISSISAVISARRATASAALQQYRSVGGNIESIQGKDKPIFKDEKGGSDEE